MFLALAAWAMGYWWVVATALDRKLTVLNGHEAVPGITLSYAAKTVSGFPFNIDVVFTGFTAKGAGAHGPFAWHSENFAIHALTYGRSQEIFEAAGQQDLSWTDGGMQAHHIHFLPATLRASAIADANGLARFDLVVVDAGGKQSDGGAFTIAETQFHLRRDKTGLLDIVANGKNVDTGDIKAGAIDLSATLKQASAFAPLLAGRQSWPDAAAAWRDSGAPPSVVLKQNMPQKEADAVRNLLASLY
jgi:hypothetical protein